MEDVYPPELIGAMAALHIAQGKTWVTRDQFIQVAACFMRAHGLSGDTVAIMSIINGPSIESYIDRIVEANSEKPKEEVSADEEASTHNYNTTPIIIELENGTTFRAKSVSLSDVNVSDYLK
jgi:hypothetical protein